MKLHQEHSIPQGGKRRRRLEFALFAPADANLPLAERQSAEQDPYDWIDGLTDAEFARMLGPSWAMMTERQRALYPSLPDEEMDSLWGDSEEANRGAA